MMRALLLVYLLVFIPPLAMHISVPVINAFTHIGHALMLEINATEVIDAINNAADVLLTAVKVSMYMIPLVIIFRVYSRLFR